MVRHDSAPPDDAAGDDVLAVPHITLDMDWAPDFVIDAVAARFLRAGVRSTWFVTHSSPAVSRLQERPDLFELGIHPNFLRGSTHGETPAEVLDHVLNLAPGARSMRTHGLVQSTQLLDLVIRRTKIEHDATVFLPRTPGLRPFAYHWHGRTLWRVPFFWEDDFEMERSSPCWALAPYLALGPGMKVFNFHPIHVYLNSPDMKPYRALKAAVPHLQRAVQADVEAYRHPGDGAGMLFDALVEHLATRFPGRSLTLSGLVARWRLRERPGDRDRHRGLTRCADAPFGAPGPEDPACRAASRRGEP